MNGIDILWALLTLLSVILFISGDWLAQRNTPAQLCFAGDRGYLSRRGFPDPAESRQNGLPVSDADLDHPGVVHHPQPLPRLDPSVVCQPSSRRPGDERCLRRGPYVMLGAAGALIILINQEGKL
jgi:hypothetical protein